VSLKPGPVRRSGRCIACLPQGYQPGPRSSRTGSLSLPANWGTRSVAIPQELLPVEGRRLVQVFAAGEALEAIPLDQALVTAGGEPPVLYVPDTVELRWAVQD